MVLFRFDKVRETKVMTSYAQLNSNTYNQVSKISPIISRFLPKDQVLKQTQVPLICMVWAGVTNGSISMVYVEATSDPISGPPVTPLVSLKFPNSKICFLQDPFMTPALQA